MKRILLSTLFLALSGFIFGQTTYYWVGGTTPTTSISTGANWNTVLNGSGAARGSSTGATDILVFDGSNVGGATPATGPVTVLANNSITAGQMRFINNANIVFIRASASGTSTITISGGAGDDFVVEAGSSLGFPPSAGSIRMALGATTTGRVSGSISMTNTMQARFDNTSAGTPGSFVFTNGSSFTTNLVSSLVPPSSSYAFGGNTQSSEKWVVFEAGAHLYYDGGYSPMGNNSAFSPIDFKPGSVWHHRASNPTSGFGSFFNRKSFGDIIVENNATLFSDGPIYRIGDLTINAGSTFTTHVSGQTAILGNLTVNGSLTSDVASTNEVVMAGSTPKTISGSGTINIASLIVAANADVTLNKDIMVDKTVAVYGKLNFATRKIQGNASFLATGPASAITGTGNLTAGSFLLTGNSGIANTNRGMNISGAGIPANTSIVSFSGTNDTIFLSNPITSGGAGVALSVSSNGATLQTASTDGFNPASGSVSTTGNHVYQDRINYIINAATTWPFGVSTAVTATPILAEFIEIYAPVTVNRAFSVSNHLTVNGKIILRATDTVRILTGATVNGPFNSSNYIAAASNTTTGEVSVVRYDAVSGALSIPIGTASYYLPVTITPTSTSSFAVSVFEGITANGMVNGTPLLPSEKQTVVNVVWNINRLTGSGNTDLQLGWNAALEGSTFATLPNTDIGMIANGGSSWSLPIGVGDNTANTVTANVSSFGAFGAGAVPQVQPFVFNTLPPKIYGDADFNGGATSLNSTVPIVYSSSNLAVATIVNGNIHITGAGISTITATQASDGFYPAASVTQLLTVSKATLTITADNKTKFQGQVNPPLTATYTGFVAGETVAALLTPPVLSTTAVTASPAGTYPITVTGATSSNYTITFVNGTMTVQPQQSQTITFNALPAKTYGNADFAAGATSTNATIPISYSSSNTSVATIIGNNIHIVGAGTSTITASQPGNAGYFPAPDVARTLTVSKAALTVRVRDTTRVQGEANPPFTLVYTGFVLSETAANLTTPPTVSTIATTASPAGYYTLTPEGATSNNYNITYVNGRLTIFPPGGTNQPHIHAFMSNPSTLTVRLYATFPALADVMLFDMSGKPLLRKNVFLPQGFINTDLNVSMVPAGIYTVTVRGSGFDMKKTILIIK
ncbi:MAG: MBG-2 domain-containing protein [Chitinophagaceae bacterium]|nr:MBG-2 domain-containing protein [Chitinophagaceae bacterium]